MNLFYIDKDPKIAARYQCDKHNVKMIQETALMLSTAHHEFDSSVKEHVYKPAYRNHPSTKWLRSSAESYFWGFKHLYHLCQEYTYRYGKVHKTSNLLPILGCIPEGLDKTYDWQDPPQCMYDECKDPDTITAYRNYYKVRRNEIDMRWTNREIPAWL